MKKLMISLTAALMLLASSANAAQLSAVTDGSNASIEKTALMSDMLVVTYYDSEGRLMSASRLGAENGAFSFTLPEGYASARAYDIGAESYDVVFETAATAAPAAEPALTPEATAAPAGKYLNPSYPEEIDQVLAPAVITKVVNTSGDGTDQYTVHALMRGVEVEIPVDIDTVIKYAPSAYSWIRGEDASALQKGDVAYFLTNIKGDKVRSIELLYRPTDIFSGRNSFQSLYTGGSLAREASYGSRLPSENAYVLGIITGTSNNNLTLYSLTGRASDSFDIPYTKDTVTYICETGTRNVPYIASSSDIARSSIPKKAYSDDDDITYLDEYSYNIAFVRTVDREAVDIVVYEAAEK